MLYSTLQRAKARTVMVASALLATIAMSTSVTEAQSSYQITDGSGNVVPAAAGLYTVWHSCYNSSSVPPAAICSWYVRKLYGDFNPVVVVIDQPAGHDPACLYGYNQQITTGYTRSNCFLYASAAVYGH